MFGIGLILFEDELHGVAELQADRLGAWRPRVRHPPESSHDTVGVASGHSLQKNLCKSASSAVKNNLEKNIASPKKTSIISGGIFV